MTEKWREDEEYLSYVEDLLAPQLFNYYEFLNL